jgi:subtilase family serine protease
MFFRGLFRVLAVAILLGMFLLASPPLRSFAQVTNAHIPSSHTHTNALLLSGSIPPSDAYCRANFGIDCYGPQQMRHFYNTTPLIDAGYTGKGQTIVIIDSYGSPTLAQDLKSFDAGFGIPDPPSLQILSPLGTVPFDDTVPDMDAWALETTLDVEWAHAIAPDANIVLLTSPVDETQGIQGLPEFLQLVQYALDNHLGNIISQSWGTAENTLFTPSDMHIFNDYNAVYQRAAAERVTVLGTSGDTGTANLEVDGNTFYSSPTVLFPGSSPYVTTVGGTMLYADANGNYQSESAWSVPPYVATGGGISQYYPEPAYQKHHLPAAMQKTLNGYRGGPDIAYNAYVGSTILLYLSYRGADKAGYYDIGGTSEGAPQWAGITAIANQYSHCPLGFLNPALYALADSPAYAQDFHDVTQGNNGLKGVPGYDATVGWDLTTGWGTPNVTNLVKALAHRF